jgi:hypothetical protein
MKKADKLPLTSSSINAHPEIETHTHTHAHTHIYFHTFVSPNAK